jgi:hypothetical protein
MDCFTPSQLKPTNKETRKSGNSAEKCGKVNLPPDVLFSEP